MVHECKMKYMKKWTGDKYKCPVNTKLLHKCGEKKKTNKDKWENVIVKTFSEKDWNGIRGIWIWIKYWNFLTG